MADQPRIDQVPSMLRRRLAIFFGLALLGLLGCQTQPEPRGNDLRSGGGVLPGEFVADAVRYEVLPDLTDIRFLVFRAGALARLGHNHVVQARQVRGEILVAPEMRRSRFFIEIPVKDFRVDDESARMDEGGEFTPQPDEEAVAATTGNMLGKQVLDAASYPTIEINSVALTGPEWGPDVTVRIGMRGVEREIVVPTAVELQRGTLIVTATFSVRQSDFGIAPMRVLGGALQVDDMVKVRMRIVAGKRERPA